MKLVIFFIILYTMISANVTAGITLEGTRVIFDSSKFSHSVVVKNTNAYDVIVQTWVDDGDLNNQPNNAEAPIITKPSLFNLETGESKVIELINIGAREPRNEELYWLNIYEIPPKNINNEDKLTLTMQTQYKVFYRPSESESFNKIESEKIILSLKADGNRDTEKYSLVVDNNTSFHLNFAGISIGDYVIKNYPRVVKPHGLTKIPLSKVPESGKVKLNLIDDSGFIYTMSKAVNLGN
ncbi:hypothetical protein BZG05_15910 [Salinivibrio kushneri]|uniref:fimbrial biogenesis chaperone n=1 Tax=Salinivibrio kushneri TaxID=1908198 RepID=UPI00098926F5|nr:molecular chaperone [Salinivibrio kushneri]OOE32019.1 hypothetical protein BZG05_15910 [Salinivibrio kushneri]